MAWVVLILVLIVLFPRLFLFIIGAAILGVFAFVSSEKEERREFQKDANKVDFQISYNLDVCEASHPLALTIKNTSQKTLYRSSFSILGLREGYSDPLYQHSYETDKIVKIGEQVIQCWAIPSPLSEKIEISQNIPEDQIIWSTGRITLDLR